MATKKTDVTEETLEIIEEEKPKRTTKKAAEVDPVAAYDLQRIPYKLPFDRNDNSDQPVLLNGKSYLLRRGVEVMIPRNVAAVLDQQQEQDYKTFMMTRHMSEEFAKDSEKF